jgi:RecB family exonuclease
MPETVKRSLPVIPPELRDEKLPHGTYSNSQYEMYKRCPTQWEFRYAKGIKRPPKADMVRGQAVHAGTEAAHLYMVEKKTIPPIDLPLQATFERFDTDSIYVENWEDQSPPVVKNTALSLVKQYHMQALPQVQPIGAEVPFVKKVGTVTMMGFIDRIDHQRGPSYGGVEDPGQIVIYDTKTSSSKWSKAEVDASPQLTLYAIVQGGYHVGIDNLVPLKGGPAYHRIPSTRDSHAKRIYLEDLEETVDLTKRGIFPKAPLDSWACSERWCGYWSLCRGKRT